MTEAVVEREPRTPQEFFASRCKLPLETLPSSAIGESAVGLILKHVRVAQRNSRIALALNGLVAALLVAIVALFLVANSGIITLIAAAVAIVLLAASLHLGSSGFEPDFATLLRTTSDAKQRRNLVELEALRTELADGKLDAFFDEPVRTVGKSKDALVPREAFSADHGRVLIVFPELAPAVRVRPRLKRWPIRIVARKQKAASAEQRHWLFGFTPEEVEAQYLAYSEKAGISADTRDRHVIVYRTAVEILIREPAIKPRELKAKLQEQLAGQLNMLKMGEETIGRMIGDNENHPYGRFQRFVAEKRSKTDA